MSRLITPATLRAELQLVVDEGNAAVRAEDPRAWRDAMYAPEVIIVGEGLDQPVVGKEAALRLIADLIQSGAMRERTIEIASVGGDDQTAYSFMRFRGRGTSAGSDARALYVWRRVPDGWRVVADMYQSGTV